MAFSWLLSQGGHPGSSLLAGSCQCLAWYCMVFALVPNSPLLIKIQSLDRVPSNSNLTTSAIDHHSHEV